MNNLYLYTIDLLEFITAIVALIHYKKYAHSTERYFLHFLWFTFLVDSILGALLSYFKIDNTWVYYSYTGISFLFFYRWYYSILIHNMYKKITIALSAVFVILYILNGLYTEYQEYSFVIGASFLLILAVFHLHQLFNSSYTLKIKYKLSFWITTALVLFNISMIPFMLLSKYFNVLINNSAFTIILVFLNMVLYGCYIIGFTWTKKKYNHF
ncbi:hypothetical protein C1H87_02250 [Flavivirga eckloniae]|uniref:Uncharacterized protein n=1 Tax=Flavivirga eckloniae TaxID=1803846 RepID=A0A2K9PKM1_9FLAO|nr:hypothetical protein C1H87_02250 [Flavivirga eckloniae]